MTAIVVYTDGSCHSPGPGGWASVFVKTYKVTNTTSTEVISGGTAEATTNNRMEMTAVFKALEVIKKPSDYIIVSDSQYVTRGIGEWSNGAPEPPFGWMVSWKKRGWRNSLGQKIKNEDLWKKMYSLCEYHLSVRMKWVKGHSGVVFNELADQVAHDERMKYVTREKKKSSAGSE